MIPANKRGFRYFTYIEPVLKTPIVKTYGSLIFTIIAMIVFILFAIRPTLETIVLLEKNLENQKEILSKLEQKVKDLAAGKTNYDRIDNQTREKIETLVPKIPDLPSLITMLEGSAQITQASISAIQLQPITIEKPSENTLDSKLSDVTFTFIAEGSYESLKNILQSINSGSRLISITNLVFNKLDERSSSSLIMTVTGKAYYLK